MNKSLEMLHSADMLEDDRICRICFGPEETDEKLIAPCNCMGSCQFVHIKCHNMWKHSSQDKNATHGCTICGRIYKTDFPNAAALDVITITMYGVVCFELPVLCSILQACFAALGFFLLPCLVLAWKDDFRSQKDGFSLLWIVTVTFLHSFPHPHLTRFLWAPCISTGELFVLTIAQSRGRRGIRLV